MTSRAKFCPSCGARVEPKQRFCLSCGAPLTAVSSSSPSFTPPPASGTASPTVSRSIPRKKTNSMLLIVVNYAISITVFVIITIGTLREILPRGSMDEVSTLFFLGSGSMDEVSTVFLVIVIASAVAGFVGGFITRQPIPLKVVGLIILIIVNVAAILAFLAYQDFYRVIQEAQSSTDPFVVIVLVLLAGFILAVIIVLIELVIALAMVLILHAGFSYLGAKLRG